MRVQEKMSFVHFKVYVHLHYFQCYREKGFVMEVSAYVHSEDKRTTASSNVDSQYILLQVYS